MKKRRTSKAQKKAPKKSKKSSAKQSKEKKSYRKLTLKKDSRLKQSSGYSGAGSSKKRQEYSVVPLDEKTGRVVKAPKKGQKVFYGIKDKKGKVSKIQAQFSQVYAKNDLTAIAKAIREGGINHFILYEQKTKERLYGPDGKPVLTRDGRPKFKVKITSLHAQSKQQPILYSRGQRKRVLDYQYKQRTRREMVDAQLMHTIRPSKKWSQEIALSGDTIRESLKNLVLDMSLKDFNKKGWTSIFYEAVIKIRGYDPVVAYGKTELTKEPKADPKFDYKFVRLVDPVRQRPTDMVVDKKTGEAGIYVIHRNDVLPFLISDMSTSIRMALSNRGLRFTSLYTLETLAAEAEEAGNDEMADKLLYIGRGGKHVGELQPVFPEYEGRDVEPRDRRVTVHVRLTGA